MEVEYLDAWPNLPGPYCVRLTRDGRFLWVADGYAQKIGKYDLGIPLVHDRYRRQSVYREDMAYRIQKFVPRKDGNPIQLIGSLMD